MTRGWISRPDLAWFGVASLGIAALLGLAFLLLRDAVRVITGYVKYAA